MTAQTAGAASRLPYAVRVADGVADRAMRKPL